MSAQLLGHISKYLSFSLVDGPGNRFVLFLQGCNFDCVACHNPQTIPTGEKHGSFLTVSDVIETIRPDAMFLSGVTVSGGEATQQPDFVVALFSGIKEDPELAHLTTFIDSNGSASLAVWEQLAPVLDGAMIDLKAFDPELHIALTGQGNDAVLDSIRHLYKIGLLYEVRLLIASGSNNSPEGIKQTAKWLESLNSGIHIKVIGFRRHGVRSSARDLEEPSFVELAFVENQLRQEGLNEIQVISSEWPLQKRE